MGVNLGSSGLFLFSETTDCTMGGWKVLFSGPHLILITSQRPCTEDLGVRFSTLECWRTYSGTDRGKGGILERTETAKALGDRQASATGEPRQGECLPTVPLIGQGSHCVRPGKELEFYFK